MGAVNLGYDERGKRDRKVVSGKTKAEALEKVRRLQRKVDDGLPIADEHITIDELLDRWFREVLRHQVAEGTYDNYETVAQLEPHVPEASVEHHWLAIVNVGDVNAGFGYGARDEPGIALHRSRWPPEVEESSERELWLARLA